MTDQTKHDRKWIRGVNIGGWLMAERFITPYLFAVNSCHMQGSLCYYPGQVGFDRESITKELCDTEAVCQPMLVVKAKDPTDYHLIHGFKGDGSPTRIRSGITENGMDYPVDEFTLGQVLRSSSGGMETATKYMERHWNDFLTYDDLKTLKANGVTHLRIPMGYWIRGIPGLSIVEGEPYIPGGWKYFVRAAKWCRELGLIVWADLHGAPGSENGFDNSGHYLGGSTCDGWSKNPANVQRTLDILTDIAHGVLEAGLEDVVTGFGILNEPFADCDLEVLRKYYDNSLTVLRAILGQSTSVFVGDTFRAYRFNDGEFWTDPSIYHDTYLDSHPYHVFFEEGRSFTPRQHIAYVCRHDTRSVSDCCFQDGDAKQIPSAGISRLTGEWSAAFDALPTALVPDLMEGISKTGQLPQRNRTLSSGRVGFLRNFCEAQMIAYEAADSGGVSAGWLFWNFKMEGGAFAEWDFLRGLSEGWMPSIPEPTVSSESLYGRCEDIYNRTDDSYSIVNEYPDPRTLDWNQWQGWSANDDFVMSDPNIPVDHIRHSPRQWWDPRRIADARWFFPASCGFAVAMAFLLHRKLRSCLRKGERLGYTELKV
ncbi:unnamed protein product [Pseudo-nitzschia multistriata]|uniref:glucan 1,3-beta-glucosidase n=1 Tax=Pseudo-nitzschia multistriata TaxID=183589 RepID=A0A448YXY5_9STRA|nr:unnamed protein product [Pseudo-nitzschia multistriata]